MCGSCTGRRGEDEHHVGFRRRTRPHVLQRELHRGRDQAHLQGSGHLPSDSHWREQPGRWDHHTLPACDMWVHASFSARHPATRWKLYQRWSSFHFPFFKLLLLALHFLFIYLFDFTIIFYHGLWNWRGCQLLHGVASSVLYLLAECTPPLPQNQKPLTPCSQTNKRDRTNPATLACSGWLTLHRLLLPGPSEAAAAIGAASMNSYQQLASAISPELTTPGVFERSRWQMYQNRLIDQGPPLPPLQLPPPICQSLCARPTNRATAAAVAAGSAVPLMKNNRQMASHGPQSREEVAYTLYITHTETNTQTHTRAYTETLPPPFSPNFWKLWSSHVLWPNASQRISFTLWYICMPE